MTDKTKKSLNDFVSVVKNVMYLLAILAVPAKFGIDYYIDSRVELALKDYDPMDKADELFQDDRFKMYLDLALHQSEDRNTNKIKLRTLLAQKMEIEEDEVHIEIGKLYKKEMIFKDGVNVMMRDIIREIKSIKPEASIDYIDLN